VGIDQKKKKRTIQTPENQKKLNCPKNSHPKTKQKKKKKKKTQNKNHN